MLHRLSVFCKRLRRFIHHPPGTTQTSIPSSVFRISTQLIGRSTFKKSQAATRSTYLKSSMYPSYPSFKRHGDLAVLFAVPDRHVAMHILEATEDRENLRFRAAGNILWARVISLASLMSRHRIRVEPIGPNEIGITLFLPPPPCPMPKAKRFAKFERRPFTPSLTPIGEDDATRELGKGVPRSRILGDDRDWISLYEYLPKNRRRAIYIVPEFETASSTRFI
jgi:hypothetical protein